MLSLTFYSTSRYPVIIPIGTALPHSTFTSTCAPSTSNASQLQIISSQQQQDIFFFDFGVTSMNPLAIIIIQQSRQVLRKIYYTYVSLNCSHTIELNHILYTVMLATEAFRSEKFTEISYYSTEVSVETRENFESVSRSPKFRYCWKFSFFRV
jgi:hypothetical protein